jgi:hypothetical protein
MTDYGVSRLEELTINQSSSNPTPLSVRLDEIVDCLSKLAENLRESESRPKSRLMHRSRTVPAAGVRRPSNTRGITASRCGGRPVEIVLGGGTCRS